MNQGDIRGESQESQEMDQENQVMAQENQEMDREVPEGSQGKKKVESQKTEDLDRI
jgi:hypothetical protein